jgi:methylase of polypeptide subunit release factors
LILVPGILSLAFLGLAFLFWWSLLPVVLFLGMSLSLGYARFLFAPCGKNVQARVREPVPNHPDWKGGQILDIGCGGGALAIELPCRYPEALAWEIDAWGPG